MSLKKAEKELRAKQAAFDKVNDEKSKLTKSLEALQKQRSIAVRDLAAGDEIKQETIFDLEGQIAPILIRLEGLESLLKEANEKVQTAKRLFEEAQAEYQKELARYIVDREKEELANLLASLPGRKQRLIDLYASFCEELGKFQVDQFWLANGQPIPEVQDITNKSLPSALAEALKLKGLRPLMQPGHTGTLAFWSFVQLPPEIGAVKPGTGPVPALEIAQVLRGKRTADFTREFEAQHKD